MRTIAVLLISAVVAGSQARTESFAGTWTAEDSGKIFIRLELQASGEAFTGRISLGNVEVGKDGVAKAVSAAPSSFKPIFDVVRKDGFLAFAAKDTTETDHFEFRLIDAGTAELALILSEADRKEMAAEGIPAPKPFRLKRQ